MKLWAVYGIDDFNEIIIPELYKDENKAKARKDELEEYCGFCARVCCKEIEVIK